MSERNFTSRTKVSVYR